MMRHLNYGHLLYFWVVAREGTIAQAARVLHVTPQTISGQLKLLDESVGDRLFDRSGRNLVLSSTGRTVFQYADEIFNLGGELAQVISGHREGVPRVVNVGVVESIPKLVASRVLSPVMAAEQQPRLHCVEAPLEPLLGDLAVHRLDLVLSDKPLPAGLHVRAYNHTLGQSAISFFVRSEDAGLYNGDFPACLDDAPMLLPTSSSALRRRLDDWFQQNEISPYVVAEFGDSALLKAFGHTSGGVFPGPSAIEDDICSMYHTSVIGRTHDVLEHYYAISPEQRLKHPTVAMMIEQARRSLFALSDTGDED
jgi:LysR family transcriptional activator of nhaA